jgi:hypothetical protein
MQSPRQVLIRNNLVFSRVVCNLVGIHARRGDLDGTSEVHVVVAQMVGCGLKLLLGQGGAVEQNFVVNWLCCSYCGLVRDHEEVVDGVPLSLYKTSV